MSILDDPTPLEQMLAAAKRHGDAIARDVILTRAIAALTAVRTLEHVAHLTSTERLLIVLVELLPGDDASAYAIPAGISVRRTATVLDHLVELGILTAVELVERDAAVSVRYHGAHR